ncbi:MAG TPA: hypothetical protein DCZ95_18605 [Verrucomicrobia bacterium]|nr:MAG: hypothetical protein A2X46_14965 [Lentisphaerae bacterium GWF2_57_35]HBA86100.1 hypothetical protein [Verrucomicrobiota bacterium]
MIYRKMTRRERLAAEFYGYSLANYADHLEVENERYTRLMPEFVDKLERAEAEQWAPGRIVAELDVPKEDIPRLLAGIREAKKIVDTLNPSDAFRMSVRQQIEYALSKGLKDKSSINDLVTQICYCAADLGCLLEWEGKSLAAYSQWLRREKGVDYTGVGLPNLEEDEGQIEAQPDSNP